MQTVVIRDAHSRIIGYLEIAPNGERHIRDATRRLLGYYKPVPNMTYDRNMQMIGRGDQTMLLLQ